MSDVQPVSDSLAELSINEVKQEDLHPEPDSFPVICLTKEGSSVIVPSHILCQSKEFKKIYDGSGIGDEGEDRDKPVFPEYFPLNNITEEVFLKVMEWCENHVDMPDPIIQEDPATRMRIHFPYTDFEKGFLNVDAPRLCELLNAALFLDIPSLYIYGCQKMAQMMHGKSAEQIREEWGFEEDMTEEEKEEIRISLPWTLQ